ALVACELGLLHRPESPYDRDGAGAGAGAGANTGAAEPAYYAPPGAADPMSEHTGARERRTRPWRRRGDSGALFVEFASTLPFVGLALLVTWQILLVGLTGMFASHAANQ